MRDPNDAILSLLLYVVLLLRDPDAKKGDPDAEKWPRGFIYIDRAQTEQQLDLVHDRGIYFTSCHGKAQLKAQKHWFSLEKHMQFTQNKDFCHTELSIKHSKMLIAGFTGKKTLYTCCFGNFLQWFLIFQKIFTLRNGTKQANFPNISQL